MNKKEKLNLKNLQVTSFVTEEALQTRGGASVNFTPCGGPTFAYSCGDRLTCKGGPC